MGGATNVCAARYSEKLKPAPINASAQREYVGVSTASCTPERIVHAAYAIATAAENNHAVRFGGKALV